MAGTAGTIHQRHYSVEQARAARPWVSERLDRARRAITMLREPAVAEAMNDLGVADGGGFPGRRAAAASLTLIRAVSELQAVDVVVRDAERGLVDFPSIRDGAEIYLCWQEGEPELAFWHEPQAGYAGRRPL